MSIESPKSPESELLKYENLSESQKEFLRDQFGIDDSETFAMLMDGSLQSSDPDILSPEEVRDILKKSLEQE